MTTVYCTKCGMRGDSKCPHCRSVFADRIPLEMELLDNMIHVRNVSPKNDDGTPRLFNGGEHEGEIVIKHEVYFESHQPTDSEAIAAVLQILQHLLTQPGINLTVASCVHNWEIMPGLKSEIGCGHVGPLAIVPPDPFTK